MFLLLFSILPHTLSKNKWLSTEKDATEKCSPKCSVLAGNKWACQSWCMWTATKNGVLKRELEGGAPKVPAVRCYSTSP